jgi:phosphoenolpyruvate-protein kinase (PTS system EI component)
MEMGGPNSHGAVVAREYGIPAVVGVPDATLRITTGQEITVHGATGLVDLPAGPDRAQPDRTISQPPHPPAGLAHGPG